MFADLGLLTPVQSTHAEKLLHIAIIGSHREHGLHNLIIKAFADRANDWWRRFKGFASRYLPSYSVRHHAINRRLGALRMRSADRASMFLSKQPEQSHRNAC
jgi:hypothetical protein